MKYANFKEYDIANGPGIRFSLFVSGCTHHCKGCFNPETWDFNYGKPFTKDVEDYILKELGHEFYEGLTLLGGEPMEPVNQKGLLPLVKRFKELYPHKTIWCFTGFRLDDELLRDGSYPRCEATDGMLACINVLVDGRFVKELKDISLQFRGSRNQRVLDLPKTLAAGQPVIWEHLKK